MAVLVCAAQAATFTVDRFDDADVSACSSAANDCTFRGAVNKANATAGADTIDFADSVRGTIATDVGRLTDLTGTITINGPGANALTLTKLPTYNNRLFRLSADANASISGLTLTGGVASVDAADGGAINNPKGGTLAIANCVFTNNSARIGGAISNSGTLTITGSTLSGNTVRTFGGAIYNTGTATIENSTISGNMLSGYSSSSDTRSGSGAGIYNYGKLTARNCTITGNAISTTATYNYTYGGGISSSSVGSGQFLLLDSCTISNNSAPTGNGGGIIFDNSATGSTATITNCIITDNFGGDDVDTRSANTSPLASSYNIVGSGNILTLFNGTGDQTGVDPKLGPLADNGGATQTRALLAGSPAIDAGQTSLATDQRGFARPQGSAADIGAYEVQKGAPNVKVALLPCAPKTNDVLTATPTFFSDGGAVSYDYQWLRNGTQIPNETKSTLRLSTAGNGDKGDVISVIVRATDAQGTSAPASAQVTVVNSAPVAISSQGEVAAATEKAFPLGALDADGDAFTFQRVGGPRNGVADIRVDPTDGKTKLFYQSRPFYNGVDVIRFVARDSDGKLSNESTLGINVQYTSPPPANRAPIAGDTSIDTFVGKLEIKGLLGSDPDGDALTFRIVNNARYGTSEIKRDEDGQFKLFYSSLNRFYGPDRVTYVVKDSRGKESNVATVNINFLNRAPSAQNSELAVTSGALVSKYLFGSDDDGDALTFRLVNNPRYGMGEIKRDEDGKWRVYYQSAPGYVGPDRITFIAIDPMGRQSQVATASINIVRGNSAPNALQAAPRPSGGAS